EQHPPARQDAPPHRPLPRRRGFHTECPVQRCHASSLPADSSIRGSTQAYARSTTRLSHIRNAEYTSPVPRITVWSRLVTLVTRCCPKPGMLKTFSTTNDPVSVAAAAGPR